MAVATPPAICSRTFESDEIVDMLTLEFLKCRSFGVLDV